jgi:hypothetical protein
LRRPRRASRRVFDAICTRRAAPSASRRDFAPGSIENRGRLRLHRWPSPRVGRQVQGEREGGGSPGPQERSDEGRGYPPSPLARARGNAP